MPLLPIGTGYHGFCTNLVDEDDCFPHGGDVEDALQYGVEIGSMGPEISDAGDVEKYLHMFARSLSRESLAWGGGGGHAEHDSHHSLSIRLNPYMTADPPAVHPRSSPPRPLQRRFAQSETAVVLKCTTMSWPHLRTDMRARASMDLGEK